MMITATMTVEAVLMQLGDTLMGEGLLVQDDTRILLPPQRAMVPWTGFLQDGWTLIAFPMRDTALGGYGIEVEVRGYDEVADTSRQMTIFRIHAQDITPNMHFAISQRIYALLGA